MKAAPPAHERLAPREQRMVLAATVLGSSMAFIDGTVVGVALPRIQRDLSAGTAGAQWIVNAYMLMLGALVLAGGAAGDRFGRRRVFLFGVALFGAASVACGLATSVTALVASRAVQGLGAALLTPNSLALLGGAFRKEERGRAFGTWAGFAALTTALGPPLGGFLTDAVSWRAVFLINVPLALACAALALRFIPESRDPEAARVDVLGAALATLGLGALTWGLTAAPDRGFEDAAIVVALGAGATLLTLFLAVEATVKAPMMPLRLFRSKVFAGANLLTLFLYFALSGALFFIPFDLIGARGYSALEAGAALLPFSLVMGFFSRSAGRLADRIGARIPLAAGSFVTGAGYFLMSQTSLGAPFWRGLLPSLLVMASGMTLAVGPLTSTVMSSVDEHRVGVASGINNAVARVAGLLAVAVLGIVVSYAFERSLPRGAAGHDARALLARAMAGEQVPDVEGLRARFHDALGTAYLAAALCAVLGGATALLTGPAARRS